MRSPSRHPIISFLCSTSLAWRQRERAPREPLVRGYAMGSISMTCYGVGVDAQAKRRGGGRGWPAPRRSGRSDEHVAVRLATFGPRAKRDLDYALRVASNRNQARFSASSVQSSRSAAGCIVTCGVGQLLRFAQGLHKLQIILA